jgi:uroporphyrinogen decarboxylase
MDLTAEAEALGATVKYQESAFPYITKHPFQTPMDFPNLEPPEIKKTRLSVFVETTRGLVRQVGKTHFVSSYVIGPFTLAGQLMGVDPLFELITENPDRASSIVSSCEQVLEPYVEQLVEAGTHNVIILEPTASSSVVPPAFFVRYSVPYVKRLVSIAKSYGTGSTLHICGNTTKIIGLMCETGVDALSLDSKISIEAAMKEAHQRCTIIGNVDTTLMLTGTVEEVTTATKQCIQAAGPSGAGFIASTGCDLPIDAPFDNVRALVDTAKSHRPGR